MATGGCTVVEIVCVGTEALSEQEHPASDPLSPHSVDTKKTRRRILPMTEATSQDGRHHTCVRM